MHDPHDLTQRRSSCALTAAACLLSLTLAAAAVAHAKESDRIPGPGAQAVETGKGTGDHSHGPQVIAVGGGTVPEEAYCTFLSAAAQWAGSHGLKHPRIGLFTDCSQDYADQTYDEWKAALLSAAKKLDLSDDPGHNRPGLRDEDVIRIRDFTDKTSVKTCGSLCAFGITGGDQERGLTYLRNRDGTNTGGLDLILKKSRHGMPLIGTSAGTELMGSKMPASADNAFTDREGAAHTHGIGALSDLILDVHTLKRNREGSRDPELAAALKLPVIAVDEGAVVYFSGRTARVGSGYAAIVDGRDAHYERGDHVKDAKISYLPPGTTFDVPTLAVTPPHGYDAPVKTVSQKVRLAKNVFADRPEEPHPNILPLAQQLVASEHPRATGLNKAKDFKVVLAKAPDTRALRDPSQPEAPVLIQNLRISIQRIKPAHRR